MMSYFRYWKILFKILYRAHTQNTVCLFECKNFDIKLFTVFSWYFYISIALVDVSLLHLTPNFFLIVILSYSFNQPCKRCVYFIYLSYIQYLVLLIHTFCLLFLSRYILWSIFFLLFEIYLVIFWNFY